MPKRRDRHHRGLRGPIALPNPYTGRAVPLRRAPGRAEFFLDCMQDAVGRVTESCPRVLVGVDLGIEEVPNLVAHWTGDRVPLALAVEASVDRPAQIVLYRRPLEHRASSRQGLRILVHRTLVEQLSALTGVPTSEIDPLGDNDDEW